MRRFGENGREPIRWRHEHKRSYGTQRNGGYGTQRNGGYGTQRNKVLQTGHLGTMSHSNFTSNVWSCAAASFLWYRIASKPSLVKSIRTGTSVLTIVSRFLFDLIWFRTSSQRLLEEWIVEYRGQIVAGYLRRDCLSDKRVYLPCFTLF